MEARKFALGAKEIPETLEALERQLLRPPVVATTCLSIEQCVFHIGPKRMLNVVLLAPYSQGVRSIIASSMKPRRSRCLHAWDHCDLPKSLC
jgi:hypothetical protein